MYTTMNEVYDYLYNSTDSIYDDYNKLIKKYGHKIVDFVIYDLYEIIFDKFQNKKNRDGQQEYRNNLINMYKSCIVTGDDAYICDAAHILDFSMTDCYNKYNKYNGLLLNPTMHRLFDKNYLIFDHINKKIVVKIQNYEKYNGKSIELPEKTWNYIKKWNKLKNNIDDTYHSPTGDINYE